MNVKDVASNAYDSPADGSQAGQPQRAEDQDVTRDHLQREAEDLHPHHHLRAGHRDVERGDRPEHQRRGQGEADDAQIPRHQRLDGGRGLDPREPPLGEGEKEATRRGEQQGQPQALHVARPDGRVAPAAMMLGNDGVERVDGAEEAQEDARVDARPQPHGGEVGR